MVSPFPSSPTPASFASSIPKPISVFPSVSTRGLKDSISTLRTSLEVKWGVCSTAALPFANALLAGGRRKKSLLIYRFWLSRSLLFTVTEAPMYWSLGRCVGSGVWKLSTQFSLEFKFNILVNKRQHFFFIFPCYHSPPNCQEKSARWGASLKERTMGSVECLNHSTLVTLYCIPTVPALG